MKKDKVHSAYENMMPRTRCHLYMELDAKKCDGVLFTQIESLIGCKIDPWGTDIVRSEYIESWETDHVIRDFMASIKTDTWTILNELIDRFDGELLLSVEIWFSTPPALTISKFVLSKAIEYNFSFDFDLYPLPRK